MYTVYIHINKQNKKKYIGITSMSTKERWRNGYGYSDKLPIGRAIRKYGWNGFIHEILCDNLSENDAKNIEIELIRRLQTQNPQYGYNICAGGNGVTGWHPSEETKRKISESARKRIGEKNPNFNHKWTDEMRKKASVAKLRANLSEETLQKMSKSATKRIEKYGNSFAGKKHTKETKEILSKLRSRPVKMFDTNFIFICEFPSIKNVAEQMGINKVGISNCCRGKTQTSGGYIWRYSDKCDL